MHDHSEFQPALHHVVRKFVNKFLLRSIFGKLGGTSNFAMNLITNFVDELVNLANSVNVRKLNVVSK